MNTHVSQAPNNMEETNAYYPMEQPGELGIREKEDAMGAYLMMFAAIGAGLPLPIINLIAAVIYYYINKSSTRFVRFHSLQALLATIPTTLLNAGAMFWIIRIFFWDWHVTPAFKGYIIAAILFNLAYFTIGIIAAIKAHKGVYYYYLFFGKIAYQNVFSVRQNDTLKKEPVNHPPVL